MTLRDHGFKLDVRRPDLAGEASIPPDLDDVHGIVVMGGPQNLSDKRAWLDAEVAFVRSAHDAGVPLVGVCLGAQIIAKGLGAEVGPLEGPPEAGFAPVELTVPAQTEPMLAGVPWTHDQFHAHGQEIKGVPEGATLLASSERCRVQAFKAGMRTFGFQFHFECDRAMIERFSSEFHDLFASADLSSEQVAAQADRAYNRYATVGGRLCVNLAAFAFPFAALTAV